jgi:hypothetical protein
LDVGVFEKERLVQADICCTGPAGSVGLDPDLRNVGASLVCPSRCFKLLLLVFWAHTDMYQDAATHS